MRNRIRWFIFLFVEIEEKISTSEEILRDQYDIQANRRAGGESRKKLKNKGG